jgi:hypothetical protein
MEDASIASGSERSLKYHSETFLSAGAGDFPIATLSAADWKVRTTGRLGSLPYVSAFMPTHAKP